MNPADCVAIVFLVGLISWTLGLWMGGIGRHTAELKAEYFLRHLAECREELQRLADENMRLRTHDEDWWKI